MLELDYKKLKADLKAELEAELEFEIDKQYNKQINYNYMCQKQNCCPDKKHKRRRRHRKCGKKY